MRRLVLAGILIFSFIIPHRPVWAGPPPVSRPIAPLWRVLEATPTSLLVDVVLRQENSSTTTLLALPPQGLPKVQIVSMTARESRIRPLQNQIFAPSRQQVVQVQPVGFFRTLRLARLTVRPFYWGSQGEIYRVERLRLRVRFPVVPASSVAAPEPALDRLVRRVVLNPNYPTAWHLARTAMGKESIPDNPPAHRADSLRIKTRTSGIYVISRDAVAAAGWDVDTIDPRDVHLWLNGQEVPVWFVGQNDGHWDAKDEIRFYAPPFYSRYTDERVWWLTVEPERGRRWQAVRSGEPAASPITIVPATAITEHDRVYDSAALDLHGDHWFWYDLKFADFPPYPTLDFPFQVPAPASVAQARVRLHLFAYKGERHDFLFRLNGAPAGELHSSWQGARDVYFSLPDGLVRDGQNILSIQSTDRGTYPDGVYVDAIEVTYRRTLRVPEGKLTFAGKKGEATYQMTDLPAGYALVIDVTHPLRPTLIYSPRTYAQDASHQALEFRATGKTGAVYHVQSRSTWQIPIIERNIPSNLHAPTSGADVIVIAPRAWHDDLTPWVRWRTQQGHQVKVVALQDIYDEFSYGQLDPEAIRRFLRQAYATWPDPAPMYVLLVGDGSYDFKDNLGFHPDNILPPYLANVDPWLGETAADIKYAEVSGDDDVPDLLIGRWPVGNEQELKTVIQKTLSYERDMPLAPWQRRIVFVADNYRNARGVPDRAGDFAAEADYTLKNQLPPPFLGKALFFMPWKGGQESRGISNIQEMRSQIVLTWNQGAGIINWIGHASYEQWGEENFLHARHLDGIHNQERLSFLFSITCFTGYFHHPEYPSLDEVLLVKPDGGTVASWSPTGLAVAYGHQYLQQGFYAALAAGERNVGRLTLAGHLFLLAQAAQYSFLPQTYVILGDPVLKLKLGQTNHVQFIPRLTQAR